MPREHPLRIGVDARPLLEPPGGFRRYLESILPALYSAGPEIEWQLFLPRHTALDASLLPPGGRVTIVPGSLQAWLRVPWEEWLLPRALESNRVDVLFSPYGAVPRRAPCPVVGTIHDIYFAMRPDTVGYWHRRYWNSVARRSRGAATILTPSESVRRDAIALLGLGPDRVVVIPHGVSSVFQPRGEADPEAPTAARTTDGPYILSFGPWTPRKNLAMLAEATRGFHDSRGKPIHLAVTGPSPVAPRFDHLVCLQTPSDRELAALMRGAMLSCVPSLHEGFGLPALEAMACGSAVVVSGGGALPEVTGGAAVVVESQDPLIWRGVIERLLADPGERRRLGIAGVERSRFFSWEKAAREYLSLLGKG